MTRTASTHTSSSVAGAQRILEAVQAARDDVAAVSGQVRGTVTLGCTLNTGTLDLAEVCPRPSVPNAS